MKNIICDKCGKEITSFTRELKGTQTEEWVIRKEKATFKGNVDFSGEEESDFICNNCYDVVSPDVHAQLDAIMQR